MKREDSGDPDLHVFALDVRKWLDHHADRFQHLRMPRPWSIERVAEEDSELHRALYESGLCQWGWPGEYGGLGGDPLLRAVLHEELGHAGYVSPESFIMLEVMGPPLIHFAPHIVAFHLPAKLSGREEWCQGFSEPDAGSDLASLRTCGVVDGDSFRLNGQKIWSSSGHLARWCMLLARTGSAESRHKGLTMFWLDLESDGVTVRPIACASGRNEVAEIFLDDVLVPAQNVIGEEGRGWDVVMHLMQYERGNFRAWLRQSWLHLRFRSALRDVSELSNATSLVGDAYLSLCGLRQRSLATVTRLAHNDVLGADSSIDKILLGGAERGVFDAISAVTTSNFLFADDDESALTRQNWFFSRAVTIYGGAGEVQRDLVAQRLLGMERQH